MKFMKKYFVMILAVTTISGCATTSEMMEKIKTSSIYEDEGVNVYLKSFSDHRQGEASILPTGESIIYAYEPDVITNGELLSVLGYDLYNTLDKERKTYPTTIGIDISIRDVETVIRHGSLSRLGYYNTKVQARVIISDTKTDEVLGVFPVIVSRSKVRTTTTGRQPTVEADRRTTVNLLAETSRDLSDKVLEKSEVIIEDYVESLREIKEVIESETDATIEEKEIDVPSLKEENLNLSPDVIEQLEKEEQKLLDRKERQRRLYEEKMMNDSTL